MANIFTLENIEDFSEKLNIDDLYTKKHQQDLNKLALFNKILNRVHVKIKSVSRHKTNEQICWFLVPEVIIGVPRYDQGSCIAYLIDKLKINGFNVRYTHPNMLWISWLHWVPSYVRTEIKKKIGIDVDEYGNRLDKEEPNTKMVEDVEYKMKDRDRDREKNKKEYTPIKSYKPSGNLIYNEELLTKIESKLF
jgi:hypothetical protein